MDTTALEELLDEMFSSLEDIETKAAATLLGDGLSAGRRSTAHPR